MILLDTNIVLDVIQKREPQYQASATVLDRVVRRQIAAALPAHAITTVYFIVNRYQDQAKASKVIGWLLDWFNVAAIGKAELMRAQTLGWSITPTSSSSAARATGRRPTHEDSRRPPTSPAIDVNHPSPTGQSN